MMLRALLPVLLAVVLSGCAQFGDSSAPVEEPNQDIMSQTLPPKARDTMYRDQAPPPPQVSRPAVEQPAEDAVVTAPPAVQSLLDKAVSQRRAGEVDAAVATVERAIRLAPRYPGSYYLLADIRFEQGQTAQARSLAQKSLALGADGELKRRVEDLIASCDAAGG